MSFINNPNQFAPANIVEIGLLSSAGLSASDLGLADIDPIELITGGESAATAALKQNFALSLASAGAGEILAVLYRNTRILTELITGLSAPTLNLSVGNGIKLARTEGIAAASLYLGQDITDLVFATAGQGQPATFLRLNGEANVFIEPDAAGAGSATLNLLTEQLVFFRSNGTSRASYSFLLDLVQPAPILNEISPTAFQAREFRARLFVNGSQVKFKSFEYNRPKGSLISSLSITLAKPELSQIPKDAVYTFQIGRKIAGVWTDHTILENASLDARSYSLAFLGDSLSFSMIEPAADKLSRSPAKNIICYDRLKVSFENENDEVFDADGNLIETEVRNIPVLSIHKLLDIAFVEGCGYDAVETNLPDDMVIQCAFSNKSTYLEALGGVIGIFKPLFFLVGNTLWILDKTQEIPDDFAPQSLPAAKILSYSASITPARQIDGYEISYLGSKSYGERSEQLKQWIEPHGNFGEPNFTETRVDQVWYHWTDGSGRRLKSELYSDKRTTYKGALAIEEIEELNFYDGQGKQTESRKTRFALLPTLPLGNLSNQLIKRYVKEFLYQTDPFDIKRVILGKTITQVSGLFAIDSENQQLGVDYKRDFEKVYESGNLLESMTSDTGDLETVVETFVPIGNGQVRVYTTGTDHLRAAPLKPFSEVQSGDISLNAVMSKPLKLVVYRDGITAANKQLPLAPFNIGELNLFYGRPLAERELERELAQLQDATIEVFGFDESVDRGAYFSIEARGTNLGNFLTEGLLVKGDTQAFTTTIEASEAY